MRRRATQVFGNDGATDDGHDGPGNPRCSHVPRGARNHLPRALRRPFRVRDVVQRPHIARVSRSVFGLRRRPKSDTHAVA